MKTFRKFSFPRSVFFTLVLFGAMAAAAQSARPPYPRLRVVKAYERPVITVDSAGAEGNKFGIEDGRIVKIGNTYHLITTEMFADPFAVKTNIGHWASDDRVHWKRISALYTSSGDQTGKDPRAALWGPMPIWNQKENQWELYYVTYRSQAKTEPQWLLNYEGRIVRAVSRKKGPEGIGGPYEDVGIILEPGPNADSWEGLQGTDSFFPYQVGDQWYGIYGSAHTEKRPITSWPIGLASAPDLPGPWKRETKLNPLQIEPVFSENPIVTKLDDGTYMAVYDENNDHMAIGYSWSADGIHWEHGRDLVVQTDGPGKWAKDVRTPLGLIPEGDNTFTLFYTAALRTLPASFQKNNPAYFEALGFVTVKLESSATK